MNLLIKSATIVDPASPLINKVADILIEKGVITKIAKSIEADVKLFDAKANMFRPAFLTLNCNIGELGLKLRKTCKPVRSCCAGGFTGMA
jgi:dihydroorotase